MKKKEDNKGFFLGATLVLSVLFSFFVIKLFDWVNVNMIKHRGISEPITYFVMAVFCGSLMLYIQIMAKIK